MSDELDLELDESLLPELSEEDKQAQERTQAQQRANDEDGDRIEKEFREKLKSGQITSFRHLVILTDMHTRIRPKERYVALVQDTADVLVEQFKKDFDLSELMACHSHLSRCLAAQHFAVTPLKPYEIECQRHIRKLSKVWQTLPHPPSKATNKN